MDQRRLYADRHARDVELIDAEKKKISAMTENTMARLINNNQSNFYTSKLNYIFHGWKNYMDRRRRCC